jgi:membrane protease YdiL (CAAX protease family)
VSPETEVTPNELEPSWNYNDLLIFVFLAMLSVGAAQLLAYLAEGALHLSKAERPLVLMPSQVVLYAFLFLALYGILKLEYGRPFLKSMAWVDFPFSAAAALTLGVMLAFGNGMAARLLHTPEMDTPIQHLFDRRITAIEFGLIGTTVGPLCEEFVFRGFMQPLFVRSLGPVVGILITAALFGSLHLAQNKFAWQSGLLIMLAGVAFGWMRQVSGSTRASTLMHSAYNFTYFMAAFSQTGNITHK